MNSIGEKIRELRESRALPLRIVAAYLDIDQAILSKIERGHRRANREQIVKLAAFFSVDEEELLVAWLSEKVLYEVADENVALQVLKIAEERIRYNIKIRTD